MKKTLFAGSLTSLIIIVGFLSLFIFNGCLKDDVPFEAVPSPPDLSTTINSSVSGFVTDENNVAVAGVLVKVGDKTIFTDKYGYFEVKNANVIKDAATITVTRTGYFKSIKTYMVKDGKKPFFRIKLIPLTNSGAINATAGGDVTLASGSKISLPANSVVNASTNAAYTGTVNIAAYWIDPTGNDLPSIMPGDLRGVNTEGNVQLLTTYGMVAVQLTGTGGELLQIATGKKANITFPIPSSITATAPATIPLWYFDEADGLWKEEGSAIKTGNTYVGEVSHFSFWNVDVPNNYVQFSCTVLGTNGAPVANAFVKVSVGNSNSAGYGYTDPAGFVSGFVPDNSQLLLEIYNNYTCNNVSYSQNFTTTNASIPLGNITVNTTNALATLTGTITNCANNPVTNGYILISNGNYNYAYPVTNGTFTYNLFLCSNTANVSITAIDNADQQESDPTSYTINAGNNAIGNIQACGVSVQQFLNYSINGTTYSYISPVDTFFHSGGVQESQHSISAYHTNNTSASFDFSSTGIAQGSDQPLLHFWTNPYIDSFKITTPINVSITEYGPNIGDFISGNFTGTFTGVAPTNTLYTITANFRFKRRM